MTEPIGIAPSMLGTTSATHHHQQGVLEKQSLGKRIKRNIEHCRSQ
jgi:hypothetical protein